MNANEKLQEIADNILKKLSDNQRLGTDVKVIIYMDDEFFIKLSSESHRTHLQSSQTGDFIDSNTIIGYPVFRVVPQYTREGTVRHPDYEIAIL